MTFYGGMNQTSLTSFDSSEAIQNSGLDAPFCVGSVTNILFTSYGHGVFYGPFNNVKGDGIIKIKPGGYKKRFRTKTLVKFFVLSGQVDVTLKFDEMTKELELLHLIFLAVKPGTEYSIRNNSSEAAVIHISQLDD